MSISLRELIERQNIERSLLPAIVTLVDGKTLERLRLTAMVGDFVLGYRIDNPLLTIGEDRIAIRTRDIWSIDVPYWDIN